MYTVHTGRRRALIKEREGAREIEGPCCILDEGWKRKRRNPRGMEFAAQPFSASVNSPILYVVLFLPGLSHNRPASSCMADQQAVLLSRNADVENFM